MTNNKLAVEWLAKSYVDLLTKLNNEEISLKEFEIQYIEILEQAKEMEKAQKATTWNNAIDAELKNKWESFEQFHNETYE